MKPAINVESLSKHPWNTGFQWEPISGPFEIISPEQAKQFNEDGFCLVKNAFSAELLKELMVDLDELDRQTEEALQTQENGRVFIVESGAITFGSQVVKGSSAARKMATHEVIAGICRDIVGSDVRLYHDQFVYKKPEKPRRFPWHQDNGYTFTKPQQYLTCWVALTDATIENGCPQIAPGIHKFGTLCHEYVDPLGFECFEQPPVEPAVVEVPAGSIAVFSSLTPHMTGPNTSGAVRKAYILQYAPDGAHVLEGDAKDGAPTGTRLCTEPESQFFGGE